jgi:hypothetical protein
MEVRDARGRTCASVSTALLGRIAVPLFRVLIVEPHVKRYLVLHEEPG